MRRDFSDDRRYRKRVSSKLLSEIECEFRRDLGEPKKES